MANPQAENGHVDIANEIIEALAKFRIPGEAMQCLWVVFRKTYGWHKLEDEISLTQFSELTGLSRSSTVRAINWLVTKKILARYKEVTTYANKYKFNKNFDTWIHGYKKDTTKKVTGVTKKEPEVVTKKQPKLVTFLSHTKETSKETSKENIDTLFKEFWESYPKRNGKKLGKYYALAQFVKLECAEQMQVITAAKNYFNSASARGGYAVDPIRFFKSREYPNGLWREWLEGEETEEAVKTRTASQKFVDLISNANNRSWPTMPDEVAKVVRMICANRKIKWPELHRQVNEYEIAIKDLREEFERLFGVSPPQVEDRKMVAAGSDN